MTTSPPLAVVAGAGAGLGQSLLSRFEAAGMTAVGLGRTRPQDPVGTFHAVDLTNTKEVNDVMTRVMAEHGPPRLVVHNTAELVIAPFADTQLEDFERCWSSMVRSLVVLAQNVMEPMVDAGGGTLIVSGATASLRGGARFAAFASAKFALRGLTQSLAREYQQKGVHVAHVILDGIIDTHRSRDLHDLDPAKMMKPKDIAEAYWLLHQQAPSTWTHELDLRPASETF